ncbi:MULTISPECIES: hypothetical protein [Candidatus Ichthyocystis]|uniref:Uncharacterized protein n=2 Tax=Candidatus Ichthyocystis hellenicum TaxID=1561003 RepID=A0A0S4M1V2_9BURK|nr:MULTISPECIES: hypothetical protein [Ichthyocystis]CUT16956.1 hypothetical protein Ark11_0096 [Candidatus Ichthyocystis hellenicum]
MIPGNIVVSSGESLSNEEENPCCSINPNIVECESTPSYTTCINKLSTIVERMTAREWLETKLSEISSSWGKLSSLLSTGYEKSNDIVQAIEGMCHQLSCTSNDGDSIIFKTSAISDEEIMLCWADQVIKENEPNELGLFQADILFTLEKISFLLHDPISDEVSSLIQTLLSILFKYKDKTCSCSSLEKILETLVDKELFKSEVLLSCHPDNGKIIKEIVSCFVCKYQISYICEKTDISNPELVIDSIAESIGFTNYSNIFVDNLGKTSRNLPLLSKYDRFSNLNLLKIIKLISCSVITDDILNFFLYYLEYQEHSYDLLSIKEIKYLLCEIPSTTDYLGKIIKENALKNQEKSLHLNEIFAKKIILSITKNSPVIDSSGNTNAKLDKKSITLLSMAKEFFSINPTVEEKLQVFLESKLKSIYWDTRYTSISVLESSISVFSYFDLAQYSSIRTEFLKKVDLKINELAKIIVKGLEELVELGEASKKDSITSIIKLLSILKTLRVELIHLPTGITSEPAVIQKAIYMISSEKRISLITKILSSDNILATEKILEKMAKKTSSSAPMEVLESLSALKRLSFRMTKSEHKLTRSVSYVSKDKKSKIETLITQLMGFNYHPEFKYYYQTCGELPIDYLEHIKTLSIPATRSDMGQSFTVESQTFSFSETLYKDLNRCSYLIGGIKVSTSCEDKSLTQISDDLMINFISMAADIGLSNDIIEQSGAVMNQSIAAIMLDAGYRASNHMFPPGSGIGLAPTLSGNTEFTLDRLTSGNATITCCVSATAKAIVAQEPGKNIDIEKDTKAHRLNSATIIPSDDETITCLEGIKLSSSICLEISPDGNIKVTKFSYEADGLSPEKISTICKCPDLADYLPKNISNAQ